MRSLPIWLCAAIASGAALGLHIDLPALVGLGGATCLTVAAIVGVIATRPRLVLSAALAGALFNTWTLSAATDRLARRPPLAAVVERALFVEIEGRLRSDAAVDGDATRIVLTVTHVRVDGARTATKGDVMLTVTGRLADGLRREWRAGRTVAMPASLRRPARYLNDGVPDLQLAAARRGLILVGTVKSGVLVRLIARGSWTEERAADLRAYVRDVVGRRIGALDPTAGAIATAILIGDRTGLDATLEDRLQSAGTYHVIAISGGNIAILAVTLLGLTSLARLPTGAAAILVAVLLAFHATVVGGGASVTRATAMAIAYLLLDVADLRAALLSALAAAAAAMIAFAPEIVVDAGFLLTVCATGAIVLLAVRLSQTVLAPGQSAVRTAGAAVIAASVATEIVLLPIAAALFGRVTAAGPILNLVAVPAMTVLQQAGLAAVVCDRWWPALANAAGHTAAAAAYSLVESSRLVDWFPAITKRVPAPDWWAIGIYFAAGAAFFAGVVVERTPGRWRRRLKRTGGAGFALATLWILLAPHVWRWPWTADGWLTIISIDVGQGDATLIEFPDATTMLVDAGGLGGAARFDMGARVVAPAMWTRRIGWLDALLVTHGDPDHIGGASTIVDVFRPTMFEGIVVPSHLPSVTLRALARARHLDVQSLYRQSQWRVGVVVVRVWHPPRPDWERRRVRNDDSVVIELQIGDVSIVLPGDVSAEVERELADRLQPVPFRVLKAAHHGSASSSSGAFLDAVQPSIALISCGRQNRFGHPAPSVLARYRERGVEVFRTDEDGQITLRTDGRAVEVATFTGRAWRRPPPIASPPATSPPARRVSFPASAGQMP